MVSCILNQWRIQRTLYFLWFKKCGPKRTVTDDCWKESRRALSSGWCRLPSRPCKPCRAVYADCTAGLLFQDKGEPAVQCQKKAAQIGELYGVTRQWKSHSCIIILLLSFYGPLRLCAVDVERSLRDYAIKFLTWGKKSLYIFLMNIWDGICFFPSSWFKQNDSEEPNVQWNLLNFINWRHLSMTEKIFSFFTIF